jgi:hypothetical protein
MAVSKRKKIYLVIGLIALAIIGWFAYSVFAMPRIRPPAGDGTFANHSRRFPWGTVGIPVPGYTIEFEHFDLADPYDATYNVAQLPQIEQWPLVYLCVADPKRLLNTDAARHRLTAAVEFEITDSKGQSVCRVQQPVAKMWWSDPEGGRDTYGLYVDESEFKYDPNEKYRIRVHYTPDPALKGFKGFVFIRCGGSI